MKARLVSSIVALALSITPAWAMAAEKEGKPVAAKVQKHKKHAKAKDDKKEKPVVVVSHVKKEKDKDKAGIEKVSHVEPHKGEPKSGALMNASMTTKSKEGKKSESKPVSSKKERAAKKASPKKSDDAANDGQPERDEDFAELVARIRGNHGTGEAPRKHEATEAKEVKATEAPIKEASKAKTLENAKCWKDAVEIARGSEVEKVALKKCDGSYVPSAIEHLSVLVRPPGTEKPIASYDDLAKKKGPEIAKGIRRVDPRLVDRLQTILDHFGKKGETTKMDVVSGYRPTSQGSMHQTGRAMDFRLEGIDNEKIVAFCKTLDDTGCGYYPNSKFVHVDVRDAGAGHVSWIDVSGPGETPKYVTEWPPKASDKSEKSEKDGGPLEKTSATHHDIELDERAQRARSANGVDRDGSVEITGESIPQLPAPK